MLKRTDKVYQPQWGIEKLEDRQALDGAGLSHDAWREIRFSLADGAVTEFGQVSQPTSLLNGSASLSTADVVTQDTVSNTLVGANRLRQDYPYTGAGYSVAIIDSGIDYRHGSLGGGWGAKVVGGYDFVDDDSDPMDSNGHGTHVAGIVASSDPNYGGIAPDVKLVALRVLDSSGSGSFGDVEAALQWVIAHRAEFNIAAVNLSLGSGNYTVNPYDFLEDEFSKLKSAGVFTTVASGNSYFTYNSEEGLDYPAISSQVVSVGSVWNGSYGRVTWKSGAIDESSSADRITSFTQRSVDLDLLAPGALVVSTAIGGGIKTMAGTSMASPLVAGAAVLLRQAMDANGRADLANQDAMLAIFRQTGKQIVDGQSEQDNVRNTGRTFSRIDIDAAVRSFAPPPIRPDLTTFVTPAPVVGFGKTSSADTNGDLVLANSDQGITNVIGIDSVTGYQTLRLRSANSQGWVDPADRAFVGDVDGDGVSELIQFNRPAIAGLPLSGLAMRALSFTDGAVVRQWSFDDRQNGLPLGTLLDGLVDPRDEVFVGHFTRIDRLEALFFNRDDVARDRSALRVFDLATGEITFSSLHDGNIFTGWTDPTDESLVLDANNDGYDDLVIVNRVTDPAQYRQSNTGFVGMVSVRDLGSPTGSYRGFFRFYDWNYARPGESSVFPGYDDVSDRTIAGNVLNNGQETPVLLLVNSSSNQQAAFAVLAPRNVEVGERDSFQLLSTVFHDSQTDGAFDPDDVFAMADVDHDGSDEVISFDRGPKAPSLRVFKSFTGSLARSLETALVAEEEQDTTNVIGSQANAGPFFVGPVKSSFQSTGIGRLEFDLGEENRAVAGGPLRAADVDAVFSGSRNRRYNWTVPANAGVFDFAF